MAKSKKQKAFVKKITQEKCTNNVYELQNGKTIDDLIKSVAQVQYSLAINLIPVKRNVCNESLILGDMLRKKDRENNISDFNKGIVGINASHNELIMLNTLLTLISNSNFQLDIKNKQVDLSKVKFRFSKNIIRKLSGIHDIKTVIAKLGRIFVFKTNNRGGKYVLDRLFLSVDKDNYFEFRFSKYLAYDYQNKSVKGYAKRRGFYNKKRHTIYETLFLELLFTKTAKFKDKQAPAEFSIKIKTLLQSIKLYDMVHEHRKRVVDYLKDFFRAAFELGVFIGEQPKFETKTLNRDDLSKITLTINPDFDWTKCDWDEWNTKKNKEKDNGKTEENK